jgi:catalase
LLNVKPNPATRKIAILIADGFDAIGTNIIIKALTAKGIVPKVIAPRSGEIKGEDGSLLKVDFSLLTVGSVQFDGLFIAGGVKNIAILRNEAKAILFVNETYKHLKALCATGEGSNFIYECLKRAGLTSKAEDILSMSNGIVVPSNNTKATAISKLASNFIEIIGQHKHWGRVEADNLAV